MPSERTAARAARRRGIGTTTGKLIDPLVRNVARVLGLRGRGRTPVNFRRRDPRAIEAAAEAAIRSAMVNRGRLDRLGVALAGKRFLELGPGTDFAHALLVAESAAEILVADRFPAAWQDRYHRRFYRRVQELWGTPSPALDRVIRQRGYGGVVTIVPQPAEAMPAIADGSVDVVISNAVLEHVSDPRAVVRELARITVTGGIGLHQIDFRDHRDVEAPLEHLLLSAEAFRVLNAGRNNEVGTQLRLRDWSALWRDGGFTVVCEEVNLRAAADYLAAFLPRLAASASAYRHWPADDLEPVSAMLVVARR